jgi:hypothetical protein
MTALAHRPASCDTRPRPRETVDAREPEEWCAAPRRSAHDLPIRPLGGAPAGMTTRSETLAALVAEAVLDAELGALLWILVEGGVPLTVTGEVDEEARGRVASAILGSDPERPWVLLDADREPPSPQSLTAILQGGTLLGLSLRSDGLRRVIARLSAPPHGLPEDAVRRLGIVVVLRALPPLRAVAVHYLRPTERDGQGHVQRRPPAVLATWDQAAGAFEHFAWGVTPELADAVDRSQADLEDRQASRAAFLDDLVRSGRTDEHAWREAVRACLAAEPPREPAPPRDPARPSPFRGGLTDPHMH